MKYLETNAHLIDDLVIGSCNWEEKLENNLLKNVKKTIITSIVRLISIKMKQ